MSGDLTRLEPSSVWRHFLSIAEIPRPSGREEQVAGHVRKIASDHGFDVRTDARGNLIVRVPGSPGMERAPAVILQSHLDMVCEKNKGVTHDFLVDPIRPRLDGEWVVADGTTLGADNGIGVAAALAAATDDSVTHPPLELLFTLDEETGLTGAKELDGSLLEGRTLLNLDSEEDGVLFVGCAGGADIHIELPVAGTEFGGSAPCTVEVSGLSGGHSGMNIHENRGNAVKLLARLLLAAIESGVDLRLVTLEGGGKHNAIPREASATLYLPAGARAAFDESVSRSLEGFRAEVKGIDDGLEIRIRPADGNGAVLEQTSRDALLRMLVALPHGVLAMSRDIEGLVETSSNLATVVPDGGRFRIVTSSRSSVMPALDGVLLSIRAAAALAGAGCQTHDGYPGWKPDMDSEALAVLHSVYTEVWGTAPEVTAIHAGLECGLLGEKVPGLDMVSFGPQILGAHSPDERVHVPSVERFWRALRAALARFGERTS